MWWTIVLAGAFVFLFWKLVVEDEEQPVDRVPGPTRKPVIGCALEFFNMDARALFLMMRQCVKKHGDRYLVKIFKRRILHICAPMDVEVVLSHSRNITKSKAYTFMQPWLGTGLLLSTGSKWHKRRKILTPTFHFNILKNFTSIMEEKSRNLMVRLKKQGGGKVDVLPVISDFTLYTICETAMGTQLDSDKSANTVQYKNAIKEIGNLVMSRLTNVYLHSDFIFSLSSIGRQFKKSLKTVHEFADAVILDKKKQWAQNVGQVPDEVSDDNVGTKKRLAMLDLLLEEESKGDIDLEGIREEVNTFMFEGHDTTAMGLTFALMLLADHEEIQSRVYEECQQIFGDSDRTPSMADMAEMKYLDAVVKETLRLYPSVPFIARKITEHFMMGDLKIKKDTEVGVHIYDLHRRPELFPDPEAFRPERFLSGEVRHPYAYVPFSAGARNCIGQRFAILEMKCVLSEISRAFTLQAVEKGARPALLADMVLRPADPVYVNFIPRDSLTTLT